MTFDQLKEGDRVVIRPTDKTAGFACEVLKKELSNEIKGEGIPDGFRLVRLTLLNEDLQIGFPIVVPAFLEVERLEEFPMVGNVYVYPKTNEGRFFDLRERNGAKTGK